VTWPWLEQPSRRRSPNFTSHDYGDHVVFTIADLGDVARLSGDLEAAGTYYCEALRTSARRGFGLPSEVVLTRIAGLKAAVGDVPSAARLFGACHTWKVGAEGPWAPWWGPPQTHQHDFEVVQAQLGEPKVAAAWIQGQQLTLTEAVAAALDDARSDATPSAVRTTSERLLDGNATVDELAPKQSLRSNLSRRRVAETGNDAR
jgi:hypothetical protein